jgi:hypothetical protein
MSVIQTMTDLATLMAAVDPTPSTDSVDIQVPGRQTINPETFPLIVGYWDWRNEHSLEFHGDMHSHHRYWVLFYVLVGGKTTPIEELQTRLAPWPAAIGTALFAHIALLGDIEFMGDGQGPLFKYNIGFWPLGAPVNGTPTEYFGLRFSLMINEVVSQAIGI